MKKITLVLLGLSVGAFLIFFGLSHKAAFFSLISRVGSFKPENLKRWILGKGQEEKSRDSRRAEIQKQQESLARSIAGQQAALQLQQNTLQSVNQVQKTLQSIEEIN